MNMIQIIILCNKKHMDTRGIGGVSMELMFIGAAHEVTGSCHYLNVAGKHILVDYGME